MTTDGSGNVIGTNLLSPYGEVLSSTTSDSFSYASLYQDTEYGGDASWFRNYSTEQLRWARPDPYNGSYDLSNPQSFNRYMYVNGNPLLFVDPSGLIDDCWVLGGDSWEISTPGGKSYGSDPGQWICQALPRTNETLGYLGNIGWGRVPAPFKGTTKPRPSATNNGSKSNEMAWNIRRCHEPKLLI